MGTFKTDRSKTQSQLRKVQAMAERFAENKLDNFLETFIKQSGLDEALIPKMKLAFGTVIALSYGCGAMDAHQGKTLKTLYVPGDGATNSTNEPDDTSESQLILPGFDKA